MVVNGRRGPGVQDEAVQAAWQAPEFILSGMEAGRAGWLSGCIQVMP